MYLTSEIASPADIMDKSRSYVLDMFFKEHGYLANQLEIYKDLMIMDIGKDYFLEDPEDVKKYIEEGKSYNIVASNNEERFEIPKMTGEGYFIIQGIPKVVLIQESKSRSSMFFIATDKDVTAETKLAGSRNSMNVGSNPS